MTRNGIENYTRWIVDRALPAWSSLGFDDAAGRFRERLTWDGRPLDVPHRAMVQARQIYVFAHAQLLGWSTVGGTLAERAMTSLLRDFRERSAGGSSFHFSIDASGRPVSTARDAYTHAFVLFAMAWLYRLTGDPALLQSAEETNAYIKRDLVDARHGGVFDAAPVTARDKRQNPLMHLLEAYLALERAAPGRGYLDESAELVRVFERHLFRPTKGVLLEYFAEDWAPHADAAKATVFEPGHHFEWVWLLREYEQLSGAAVGAWADRLYEVARAHGIAPSGLVYDEVGSDMTVRKSSHRLWPHTEGLKAAAARHRSGDPDALGFGHQMARGLLDHFLDRSFTGGWADQIDASDQPIVDYVPASSLYHLFFAAAEAAAGLVPPVTAAAAAASDASAPATSTR